MTREQAIAKVQRVLAGPHVPHPSELLLNPAAELVDSLVALGLLKLGSEEAAKTFVLQMGRAWADAAACGGVTLSHAILEDLDKVGYKIVPK